MATSSSRTVVGYRGNGVYRRPSDTTDLTYSNLATTSAVGPYEVRTTNENPQWKTQVLKHADAGTYYLRTVNSYKYKGRASCHVLGKASYKGYWGKAYYIGPGTSIPTTFPSTDESLRNLALTRLKRKLQTKIGSAETLAPTAELKELKGLASQVLTLSFDFIRAVLRTRKTKDPSSLFKYASDLWLGYNFGLSPLVSDIRKVSSAIQDFLERRDMDFRSHASAKRKWTTSIKDEGFTGTYGANLCHTWVLEHELSYRYYAGGVLNLENDADYGVLEHFGLDWGALPSVAWELTAFSWVFDYVTNIGDVLGDVFWSLPGTVHYSGYTRRYSCKMRGDNYYKPWADFFFVSHNVGGSSFDRFEFERVPLAGSLPHIGFRFKNHDEVVDNAATKLLNLVSVLIQRLH